jgi:hypothetical protein
MAQVSAPLCTTVQSWLVEQLRRTASWRHMKAQDYPDDARNQRSAGALEKAADYVADFVFTSTDDVHSEISPFVPVGLLEIFRLSDDPMWGPEWEFGAEASRVAGRFCFDNIPGEPRKTDFDRLLIELADAIADDVTDLADTLDDAVAEGDDRADVRPSRDAHLEARVERLEHAVDLLVSMTSHQFDDAEMTELVNAHADGPTPQTFDALMAGLKRLSEDQDSSADV